MAGKKELTGGGGGVAEELGTAGQAGVPAEAATAPSSDQAIAGGQQVMDQAGTGEPAQQVAQGGKQQKQNGQQVDLTELPEFRRYQSENDRKRTALEQQLQQMQAELQASQQQLQQLQEQNLEAQVANLPPEEQAQVYQRELQRIRNEAAQGREQRAREAQFATQAKQLLESTGIDPDDPALDWSGGPTAEGMIKLQQSVLQLQMAQATEALQDNEKKAKKAAQTAQQEALQQAGVTQVSMATGHASSPLRQQYEQERQRLVGSGNVAGAAQLRRQYREQGLDI